MEAIIVASGIGKRLGAMGKNPKMHASFEKKFKNYR